MLARRHIRIKVLQALYGFYRDDNPDMVSALKNLTRSLDRIYDLYLYDLVSLTEILSAAEGRISLGRKKHMPRADEVNPNQNFVNNRVLLLLKNNVRLNKMVAEKHISWAEYKEHFKKVVIKLMDDEEFQRYMRIEEPSFADDKKLVKYIYATYVSENEFLHNIYEDMSIHWADDLDAAQMMTSKTIKTLKEDSDEYHPLVKLYKDKEDETFGVQLFRKVVGSSKIYETLIAERTKNWESDRIATVDNILMKMAIAEFLGFQEIPVKVTLNEYIELAKEYSTPKSATFINGVLDKLVIDLREKNEIIKIGRGLL
jgi:N utilization substance protein B